MFICVYLCLALFTPVCLPMFTHFALFNPFTLVYLRFFVFTYVYTCLPIFTAITRIHLCLPLFNRPRLPMFTHVYLCLPMFTLVTYVNTWLPKFTPIFSCLLTTVCSCLFTYVYPCLLMFTPIYICLMVFNYVYCLLVYVYICDVAGENRPTGVVQKLTRFPEIWVLPYQGPVAISSIQISLHGS